MSTARNMLQGSSSIWKRNTEVTISVVPIADAYYESENPENAGAAAWEENLDEEILPESHINKSLSAKDSIAYKAVVDGELLGGAIIVINGEHGDLYSLF